jgi:hypothetical protein
VEKVVPTGRALSITAGRWLKMAKRFADTEKYKKPFIRGLQGAYKLLWDYICLECNHAGIWQKDFEIAQIYLGADMQVNELDALDFFNKGEDRIVILDGGSKWFIRPFIEFQYGEPLNSSNRVHLSVIKILKAHKLLTSPLQGAKDKDKEKDKDKDITKDYNIEELKDYLHAELPELGLDAPLVSSMQFDLIDSFISECEVFQKLANWKIYVERIKESDWLMRRSTGKGQKKTKMGLKWLCKPDTVRDVMAGNHDNVDTVSDGREWL